MERGGAEAFRVSASSPQSNCITANKPLRSRTYSFEGTNEGEGTRSGFEPSELPADTSEFAVEEEDQAAAGDTLVPSPGEPAGFGASDEDRNVWDSPGGHR